MWKVLLEDGSSVDSGEKYWTDLSKENKIVKLQFASSDPPDWVEELSGMHSYYYVVEAIAEIPSMNTRTEAEIIGGIDLEKDTITEIRFNYLNETIEQSCRPLSEFKYSMDILIPGKK